MTLLLYATAVANGQPNSAAFAKVCSAVDERYPLAFGLVATRGPTGWVPVSSRRDWVTLPEPRAPWPQSDEAAARMLLAYAKQFRPCATLFVGADASSVQEACARLDHGRETLGPQMLISDEDPSLAPILELLDRVLPASVVVSQATDPAHLSEWLKHHFGCGVRLYWQGPLSNRIFELLDLIEHGANPNALQFGWKDISKTPASSLKVLPRLTQRLPRVLVTAVAEHGIYRTFAQIASSLARAMHRRPIR